jgi:hypothetical protein
MEEMDEVKTKKQSIRWRSPHEMYYDWSPHRNVRCIVLVRAIAIAPTLHLASLFTY